MVGLRGAIGLSGLEGLVEEDSGADLMLEVDGFREGEDEREVDIQKEERRGNGPWIHEGPDERLQCIE